MKRRIAKFRAAWWATRSTVAVRRRLRRDGLTNLGGLPRPPRQRDDALGAVRAVLRNTRATCLERALVLQAWHAADGNRRNIVIGVTAPTSEFNAHAWLEGDEPDAGHGSAAMTRLLVHPPAAADADDLPEWAAHRKDALTDTVGKWIGDERAKYRRIPSMVLRAEQWVQGRVTQLLLERHVDTSAVDIDLEHFHSERTRYEPSGITYLRRGLKGWRVGRADVFVDFGSGKGRVLYQAARRPFGRVVGVEISDKLNDVARANIDRNRDRLRCTNVEIVTADAAKFEVPDDMTIAYFYFPFSGETFKRVMSNVVASLDRRPRRLRLIYACPKTEDEIGATGRFRRVRVSRGGLFDFLPARVSVWESV